MTSTGAPLCYRGLVPRPIRLFFVDDHPVIASGLAARYGAAAGFVVVVGVGGAVADALGCAAPFDVVVVDFQLDTPLSPRQVTQLAERAAVVVFSGRSGDDVVQACLGQGAAAVVDKATPLHELDRLLVKVAAGHRQSAPSPSAASATTFFGLSERELEVYRSLVRCQTPKEVAAELGIAKSTVYCHIDRIRQKLGVETLQEIVAHGVRHQS